MNIKKGLYVALLPLLPFAAQAQDQGSYLRQALLQGLSISVQIDCNKPDYGALAHCRTYAVSYNAATDAFTASGPVAPALWVQTDTRTIPGAFANGYLVIWGAKFSITSSGNVLPEGSTTSIGTAYINNIAAALEAQLPARLNVTCGPNNGVVACGEYSIYYSSGEAKYVATGPAKYGDSNPTATLQISRSTSVNAPPAMEAISINGGSTLLFDRNGNLRTTGGVAVGTISTTGFTPSVSTSTTDKYVQTAINGTGQCHSTSYNWTAPQQTAIKEISTAATSAFLGGTPYVWGNTSPPSGSATFRNEIHQYGYLPVFNSGRVSFAPNGRPLIRDRYLNLQVLGDNGTWKAVSLREIAKESLRRQNINWTVNPNYGQAGLYSQAPESEQRVVFDNECNAYTVIDTFRSSLGYAILLHSPDGGQTWAAFPIPSGSSWSGDGGDAAVGMEVPSGPTTALAAPPAITVHQNQVSDDQRKGTVSTRPLLAFFPKKTGATLTTIEGPYQIAAQTLITPYHSGTESYIVTTGGATGTTHFGYPGTGIVADTVEPGRKGVPLMLASFSRSTHQLTGAPLQLGVGLAGSSGDTAANIAANDSVPDNHAGVSLALDSNNYIHAVLGGHASRLLYRKTTTPNNASSWSASVSIGATNDDDTIAPNFSDTYSYPSLVLDAYNQPNVFARWSGSAYRARLVHIKQQSGTWAAQTFLLDPARKYYGVWYHKASVDSWGKIFLAYSYFPSELLQSEASSLSTAWGLSNISPYTGSDNPCRSSDEGLRCYYTGFDAVGHGIIAIPTPWSKAEFAITNSFAK